jgi:hypothetical protein
MKEPYWWEKGAWSSFSGLVKRTRLQMPSRSQIKALLGRTKRFPVKKYAWLIPLEMTEVCNAPEIERCKIPKAAEMNRGSSQFIHKVFACHSPGLELELGGVRRFTISVNIAELIAEPDFDLIVSATVMRLSMSQNMLFRYLLDRWRNSVAASMR